MLKVEIWKKDATTIIEIVRGDDKHTYSSNDPAILAREIYAFSQGAAMPTLAPIITDIIEAKAGLADDGLFSWTEGVLDEEVTRLSFDDNGGFIRERK
jgi:hypothetical protein